MHYVSGCAFMCVGVLGCACMCVSGARERVNMSIFRFHFPHLMLTNVCVGMVQMYVEVRGKGAGVSSLLAPLMCDPGTALGWSGLATGIVTC